MLRADDRTKAVTGADLVPAVITIVSGPSIGAIARAPLSTS
jgi:hypothetical protein